jgi:hypothetical protein
VFLAGVIPNFGSLEPGFGPVHCAARENRRTVVQLSGGYWLDMASESETVHKTGDQLSEYKAFNINNLLKHDFELQLFLIF